MDNSEKEQLTFIDLFAGIGGFRLGMEKAGHRCIGFCEIDPFARQSYKSIHNTAGEVEIHDIKSVSDEFIRSIGSVDVLCAGFPCQSFSVAGKRRGFEDTRGTLFFEIARFTSILRPTTLFLENVVGLLNHDTGDTFETILRTLDELRYDVEWDCLNSKACVPQSRERLFIIGHSRDKGSRKIFPISGIGEATEKGTVIEKLGNIRKMGRSQSGDVVSIASLAPTLCSTTTQKDPLKVAIPILTPDKLKKRQNGRRFKDIEEEMFTLTTQDKHGIMLHSIAPGNYEQSNRVYDQEGIAPCLTTMSGGGQTPKVAVSERKELIVADDQLEIRRLTPLECWRLQAFSDFHFLSAKFGSREIAKTIISKGLDHYNCPFQQKVSDSQLYKQAGNSVTVLIIYLIARYL